MLEHAVRDKPRSREWPHRREPVERLWEACQIPDYRKIAPANHAELVTTALQLPDARRAGFPTTGSPARSPMPTGPTATSTRSPTASPISAPGPSSPTGRTGCDDPEHWQENTRELEDRLSDALHERLTERFVDRRTSVLMRRLKENAMLEAEIGKTGDVLVEGHMSAGSTDFRFEPDAAERDGHQGAAGRGAQGARRRDRRARREGRDVADEQFVLTSDGTLRWTRRRRRRIADGRRRAASRASSSSPTNA